MSININDIILNTAISKGFTIFTLYPIDYIKTNIQYGNKINYANYFITILNIRKELILLY